MAKKALFHSVRFKSGHGEYERTYAAQRGSDLKALENEAIKVVSIRSLGWHDVAILSGSTDVTFIVDSLGLSVEEGEIGYSYLVSQFRPTVNAADEFRYS